MRVATDIGGTFTDIVYIDENGKVEVNKAHTTSPNFEKGVMDAIKKCPAITPEEVISFVHGTTVVINALTEKNGAKTALLTTKGIRDIYEIARGNRPDLFNLRFEKSLPVIPRHLRKEVEERFNYLGDEIVPLNKEDVTKWVEYFKSEGVEAIAVVYLHSYVNDTHEKETVKLIKKLWPEVYVTGSYQVTKEWREYERTSTTALNSYVMPVAARYIDNLYKELEEINMKCNKYIMQSNGGTTTFEKAKDTPINMVESGPVAGIYGSAILGKILKEDKIIAFDIGGTTAKCSLIDNGEVRVTTDYKINKDDKTAGHPIKVPVVDIIEIGNGGGSIAWIDERGSLKVGPKSAGASPGPIAYGQGGTSPTTTDANLLIGRLSPKNFDMKVNMEDVEKGIKEVVSDKLDITPEEGALGIIRIANSNMLNALKLVSVRKGYDPREFSLVAFGGGGPMHAAPLAKELGIKKVIVPLVSSVFAAWGMLMTDLRQDDVKTHIIRVDENMDYDELNEEWIKLEEKAISEFAEKGITEDKIVFIKNLDMRYAGQEHAVKIVQGVSEINKNNIEDIVEKFHAEHEKTYSFKIEDSLTEVVNLHLISYGKVEKTEITEIEDKPFTLEETIIESRLVLFEGYGKLDTVVYDRDKMSKNMYIVGPAIIEEKTSSTIIYPDMTAAIDIYGNIIINTLV